MQISYNWLKQHLPFLLTPEDLSEILTNTGLEVEDVVEWESIKGGLDNVVIGEIISCEQHPNADKLKVTKVDIGESEPIQVVCGAPNCRLGLKSPVAKVGAVLYPTNSTEPFAIKKSKIRGEESFGMICADDELGLGESHEGIMELPADTKVGTPAADFFGVEKDYVLSIGLTPNRSDAFSHKGVARDLKAALSAVFNIELDWTTHPFSLKPTATNPISITVENSEACKRYSSVYLKNIKVTSSPNWLKNKLNAIGVKPINTVVDVTNFVLHELGQPLHAFDVDIIKDNSILVKSGAFKEMTTLEGQKRTLNLDDLLICDTEKPLCIAGVYGGLDSGVTFTTQNVLLESAFFDPTYIRKTANRLGLKTDASQHFEKTTDINGTMNALERAIELLLTIGSFDYSTISDIYPSHQAETIISTTYERVNKLSGADIPKQKIDKILLNLGFDPKSSEATEIVVGVPSYRPEVTREADLLEEILRIYGYNSIPLPKHLKSALSFSSQKDRLTFENKVASLLVGAGYYEISTNSISFAKYEQDEQLKKDAVILLNAQNSELDSLRTSMVYSFLEVVSRNINHKSADLKLFEFGKTYQIKDRKYEQQSHICLLQTGEFSTQNWISPSVQTNFFHLKTDVKNLTDKLVGEVAFKVIENKGIFSYGLEMFVEETLVGTIGKINTSICNLMDIKQEVYFADLNADFLLDRSQFKKVSFKELPKYPSVQRDLSMILAENQTFEQIEQIAFAENKKLLKAVSLFDIYKGDKIASGKKSYAVKFIFQDEQKTLTDKDIEKSMNRIIDKLEKDLGAEIRRK